MKNFVSNRLRMAAATVLLTCLFAGQPAFSQSFSQVNPEDAGFSSERLSRLTSTLTEYSDQKRLSGGVTLVLRKGKAVYFEAFGMRDLEEGDPMQKDDIFRIASQTKAITSVAVMMLYEQGKLLLDDPVNKFLPEFSDVRVAVEVDEESVEEDVVVEADDEDEADAQVAAEDAEKGYKVVPASRPVTIRDLLTHTSGISYGYGPAGDEWENAGMQGWYFADRDGTMREWVRVIAELPFDANPGEQFIYGYGTDILGVVVEVISGLNLDEFFRKNIFEPLEMHDTHFYLPESKNKRLVTVYSANKPFVLERAPDPGGADGQGMYAQGPGKSFSGGAGLLSSAIDYGRFLQMLLNKGELEGIRILSPKSVELMTVNHIGDIPFRDGMRFGLGFQILVDQGESGRLGSIGEFGWGGAYHSTYWVSPADELVVVFMTQLRPARGSDIHNKLRALVYQAIIE